LERAKNSGQYSSAQEVLEATGLNFDVTPSSSAADTTAPTDATVNEESPDADETGGLIL